MLGEMSLDVFGLCRVAERVLLQVVLEADLLEELGSLSFKLREKPVGCVGGEKHLAWD